MLYPGYALWVRRSCQNIFSYQSLIKVKFRRFFQWKRKGKVHIDIIYRKNTFHFLPNIMILAPDPIAIYLLYIIRNISVTQVDIQTSLHLSYWDARTNYTVKFRQKDQPRDQQTFILIESTLLARNWLFGDLVVLMADRCFYLVVL